MRSVVRFSAFFVILSIISTGGVAQVLDRTPPSIPDITIERVRGGESREGLDKLSVELRALYEQYATPTADTWMPDESGMRGFTSQQLDGIFNIAAGSRDPYVTVSISFNSTAQLATVEMAGGAIISQSGNVVYALMPIAGVAKLVDARTIVSIDVLKAARIPSPVGGGEFPTVTIPERGGSTTASAPLANAFDKQSLNGKGVIVGVIDSGVDWRHPDFIREDGTSRILALWDLTDMSYQTSKGSIGSKPPVYNNKDSKWLGTLYTNAQINAALKGTATVNSFDKFGHGTAVAGTAAGNGRATANGVPALTYAGVAPEADLIIVKAMDCGYFIPLAELTSGWIAEYAKSLGKPVVINMSFGGQFSSHDGTTVGEQFIDTLTGPGKPGKVVTVAAGNDGRYSIHAGGKFAPKRKGQADSLSAPIELSVKSPTQVLGVFNSTDNWGVAFRSSNPIFLGTDDKPISVFFLLNHGALDFRWTGTFKDPSAADEFFKSARLYVAQKGEKADQLQLQLPAGNYIMWGFGADANVTDGQFDLYVAESAFLNKAFFGMGTDKSGIVGSPGNAKNAITVGSYDFRSTWLNSSGEITAYNLAIGSASSYSSAGFRRDGVVKPDISAPARYTISPLSADAKPDRGGCQGSMANGDGSSFTRDGFHLAWDGTSAAAPFTAGLIALMLQKNPTLDAEQIRQILKKTAKSGGVVGAVPNPVWGWGMIDPAAALKATPAPSKVVPEKHP
jgi:minor extracellular serine protease Vpr